MGLKLLESLDVYYGKAKRNVSLYSGDLSQLSQDDAVDYMAVSTLPNFYVADYGTLLYSLKQKGVSVEELSQKKAADYRSQIPCWISREVSGIQSRRLVIFEPDNPQTNAYDQVTYVFSAITAFEQKKPKSIKVALPLLCTGKSGVDEVEILEAMFFASVHWGAMAFPFQQIKLVVYDGGGQTDRVRAKFKELKYAYEHLDSMYDSRAYRYYAEQVLNELDEIKLPDYLTQRQYFAIRLYTSSYYMTINRILRENDRKSEEYKRHLPLFEALDTAIMNIPPYTKMTYRGTNMPQSELDKHTVGAIYLNLAYTSTAYLAEGWYYSKSVKLDIESRTGVCIKNYSYYPNENEVLYIRKMSYKVLSKQRDGNTYHIKTNECMEKFRR